MIGSSQFGNKNETYRGIVKALADSYYTLGDFSNSTVNYLDLERAHKEDRAVSSAEFADVLMCIGRSYEGEKKPAKAVEYYQASIALREKLQATDSPNYFETQRQLGGILMRAKKFSEAEPIYQSVLAKAKKTYKPTSLDYLNVLEEVGDLQYAQRKYTEGIAFFTEYQKNAVLAKMNPQDYVDIYQKIAEGYIRLKDVDNTVKSLTAYINQLEKYNKDGNFLNEINQAVGLFKSMGKYEEAVGMLNRKLTLQQAATGEQSKEVGDALSELGETYQTMKNYPKAEEFFNRSLVAQKASSGEGSDQYAEVLDKIGHLRLQMGKPDEAEKRYLEAQAIRRKHLGPENPAFALGLDSLAIFYMGQSKLVEADTLLKESLKVKKEKLPKDHGSIGKTIGLMADLKVAEGKPEAADPLLKEENRIIGMYYGRVSKEMAHSYKRMGDLLKLQEKYVDAVKLYRQSLTTYEGASMANTPQATEVQALIKECTEAMK